VGGGEGEGRQLKERGKAKTVREMQIKRGAKSQGWMESCGRLGHRRRGE